MLAVSINGPGQLEIVERERPVVVDSTDAVVMVSTAGLGPLDIERFRRGDLGPIPGGEFCGVVVEVGADVRSVDLDDLVFATTRAGDGRIFGVVIDGGHAEYVRVPAADATLVKTNAASEERALLAGGSLGLGAAAAKLAVENIAEGGRLAVLGCDPCGMGALVWLRQLRVKDVQAMDAHPARSTLAKRYGAASAESRSAINADVAIVGELSESPGIELVAEVVKPGGAVILCRPGESREWQARFAESGIRVLEADWPSVELAAKVAGAVHMRRLDLLAAVSHVIPLDDAQEAYEAAAGPAPGVQKVLLKP